jgi:dipeptidyl aminopeptidase/acylaminoacyl peptidase
MRRTIKKSTQSTAQPEPAKRTRLKAMPTVSLGNIPPGHVSNIKFASEQHLIHFVKNEINDGPQIVSIPVPPQRHAFLVDVQPRKIMVSDWGGEENKTAGLEYISGRKNKQYDPRYKQYSDLLTKIEEKYKRPIEYYAVDEELHADADKFSECNNGNGGCSNYIYAWVKKYYPEYK